MYNTLTDNTVRLVNFEDLKFHVLSLFSIIQWYFISWGLLRPFNCTGLVGVKFHDFNPTIKLVKFKHPRNLPTLWYSSQSGDCHQAGRVVRVGPFKMLQTPYLVVVPITGVIDRKYVHVRLTVLNYSSD